MAIHSSVLAWRIPWTEKPGGLQSMKAHRVGLDCVTITFIFIFVCVCVYNNNNFSHFISFLNFIYGIV